MAIEESKVFVSYSRKDSSDFAIRLSKDLKSKGLYIWLDQLDILPGVHWDREVENTIRTSGKFLIILSPLSVSSENVLDELDYAIKNEKTIIPVLNIECEIPIRLGRRQFSDFTKGYEKGFNDLIRAFNIPIESEIIKPIQSKDQIDSKVNIHTRKELSETIWLSDKNGYFIDQRDHHKYKVVKIGSQTWMAENLAYKPNSGNYWAYDNDLNNIPKFGFLYDWQTAINISPSGWRLPTKSDIETLINILSHNSKSVYEALKPGGSSGFSALCGGFYYEGDFNEKGNSSSFWTSSSDDIGLAYFLSFDSDSMAVDLGEDGDTLSFSVRCLQDN